MTDLDELPRPSQGSILPWLLGLAVLLAIVGWLLWRNNQLPEIHGRAPGAVHVLAQRIDAR